MSEDSDQIYEYVQAEKVLRDYVCAGCYGHLVTDFVETDRNARLVRCPSCGDGRGFVTRKYAERRQSESIGEALVARKNLERAMPVLRRPERPTSDLLSELGF
jgi:DNA-directed RNA polymerase subunit RPC12/RpoP